MTHARSVAAAQTIPIRGDVDANVEQHVRLVHAAAEEQAEVLVFPELSLTGYELDLADELAFSEQDARLAPLDELASSYRMTLIVGAPVRVAERLCIGAFILSDREIGLYTKHYLGAFPPSVSPDGIAPPPEASVFHPGDRNPLVRFGEHTAAVAVCADVGRPSHPQAAAERGATNYLASMFVIPADFAAETANLRAYAQRHSMAVVFANYGGPSGGLASAGGSAIWSDKGELLAQLEQSGSGLAIAIENAEGWRAKALAQ
ncbi:MAG: carbon-nitrogen hydrolase family protein [Gemmatimonadaceae bacterium]